MGNKNKSNKSVKSSEVALSESETAAAQAAGAGPSSLTASASTVAPGMVVNLASPVVALVRCSTRSTRAQVTVKTEAVPESASPSAQTETTAAPKNVPSPSGAGEKEEKKKGAGKGKPAPTESASFVKVQQSPERTHELEGDGWKTVSTKRKKKRAKSVAPAGKARVDQVRGSKGVTPGLWVRPLDLIRDEAFARVEEFRSFVCRPYSRLSKEHGAWILAEVNGLNRLVQELVQRNSFVEGKLAEAKAELAAKSKASAVSPSQKGGSPRDLHQKATPSAASTYAQAVKVDSKRVSPDAVKPPQHVVRIFPPKGKEQSSDATKRTVLSLVKPAKEKIRVRAVRRIHSGGIAVETERKEDLQAFVGSSQLKKAGLSVSLPMQRNPSLIVYDVPKQMSKEEIVSSLREQNLSDMTQKDMSSAVKVSHIAGKKGDAVNWVIDVSPLVRKRLKLSGGRVYLGWSACRVQDFVSATRCFKCQKFGHTSKRCKQKDDTCGHCAEKGHTFALCSKKSKPPVCSNCKEKGKPHGHRSRDPACASYKEALALIVSRTNYD